MRVMGTEALLPRPGTSNAAPGHQIYPPQLRGLKIVEPNHVWAADVTYIPMACGFLYLVAIIDWSQPGGSVHGGCRTPTMRASARRRWRRRCFGSESRGFSIPIRAPLSPPRLSPVSL